MNKNDLRANAQALIEIITKIEQNIKLFESLKMHSEQIKTIDKAYLLRIRDGLIKKTLPEIEALPDEVPASPSSIPTYEFKANPDGTQIKVYHDGVERSDEELAELDSREKELLKIQKIKVSFRTIDSTLKTWKSTCRGPMKLIENLTAQMPEISIENNDETKFFTKQLAYNTLTAELEEITEENISQSITYPKHYSADGVLEYSLQTLAKYNASFKELKNELKEVISKGQTEQEKLAPYTEAVDRLEAYSKKHAELVQAVKGRIEVLSTAESVFKETIEKSRLEAQKATNLLKQADVQVAKNFIKSKDPKSNLLTNLEKEITSKSKKLQDTDYMKLAGTIKPKPSVLDQIKLATKYCSDDRQELKEIVEKLNKELDVVQESLLPEKIKKAKETFIELYQNIKSELEQAQLSLGEIQKIGRKYNEAINSKAVVSEREILNKINIITDELRMRIEVESSLINESLKEKVSGKIKSAKETFTQLYQDIESQLKQAQLSLVKIEEIGLKYNEVINSKAVVSDTDTLKIIRAITEELRKQIVVESGLINESLKTKISESEADFKKIGKGILEKVKKGNYEFTDMEGSELAQVRGHFVAQGNSAKEEVAGPRADLSSQLVTITLRKQLLLGAVQKLQTTLDIHDQAKELVTIIRKIKNEKNEGSDKNTKIFDAIVEQINKTAQEKRGRLLTALDSYLDNQLADFLNAHLKDIDTEQLLAISDFIELGNVKEKSLNINMKFISLLSPRKIDYKQFLDNENVKIAALYLDEQKVNLSNEGNTDYISSQYLKNQFFCNAVALYKELNINLNPASIEMLAKDKLQTEALHKALLVLVELKIPITEELVRDLEKSPNKCEVIIAEAKLYSAQVETYNQFGQKEELTPMKSEVFTQLIEGALTGSEKAARAVNTVIKKAPALHLHSLLLLVQESETLQNLLCSEQHAEANIIYLTHFIDKARYIEKQITIIPIDSIRDFCKSYLSRSKTVLNALDNANKSNSVELEKMSKVMAQINDFFKDHSEDKNASASLQVFYEDTIVTLLSPENTATKKEQLLGHADKHFKQKNFFLRLIEYIVNAFASLVHEENQVHSSTEKSLPKEPVPEESASVREESAPVKEGVVAEEEGSVLAQEGGRAPAGSAPVKEGLISKARQSFFSTQKLGAMNKITEGFKQTAETKSTESDKPEEVGVNSRIKSNP